jgi:hypothetical protein
VRIDGPAVVPLRETVEFTLTAEMSDGSVIDLTQEAKWTTDYDSQLAIEGPGRVRGRANGDAWITASHGTESRSMGVFVVPSGTFRLIGEVFEADAPTAPVVGAAVEVSRGVGSRQVVSTSSDGTFRLYGVAGSITLRVTKKGYAGVEETVVVDDHNQSVQTRLTLEAPRLELSGPYALTIRASKRCGVGLGEGNLPHEVSVRTYGAMVRQDGPRLEVTLSGASLMPGSGFAGRVEPDRVVFDLYWDGWSHPPRIQERLPDSRVLAVDGHAFVTGSSDHLSGTLAADINVGDIAAQTLVGNCRAPDHEFILSR